MVKDPESRDWKIDKYISKCIAIDPDKEPPTYEEVGQIIDKWEQWGGILHTLWQRNCGIKLNGKMQDM